MNVPFIDLKRTFLLYQKEYEEVLLKTARSGWYILGKQLELFEKQFSDYLNTKHCIGVGCGQDSLILAVRALGISKGDEVIVAGNTYIATVLGVTENGATPVFVDCDDYYQLDVDLIQQALTDKTKAILTTNLYGQCSNTSIMREICDHHGLFLIEDCAQSHGAMLDGISAGQLADIACYSFYPTKPLGAMGDGGACTTNNDELAEKLRMLRNYGSRKKYINEIEGLNTRLDELQAAVLQVGLKHLNECNEERRRIAKRYLAEVSNPHVLLPKLRENDYPVFHIFAIRSKNRDKLQKYLAEKGVQTQIHYPIPPYQQKCYEGNSFTKKDLPKTDLFAKQELSLPIYAGMPESEINYVIDAVNAFEG